MEAAATAALLAEAAVIRAAVAAEDPAEAAVIRAAVGAEDPAEAAVPRAAVAVEDPTEAAVPRAGIRPEAPHAAGKRVEQSNSRVTRPSASGRPRFFLAAVSASIRTLDALLSYRPLYCFVS